MAFVGNSGGGKTTLVNLLPRFYDVNSGQVTIDGTDIRRFSLDSLRDKIAVVFQDNFCLTGPFAIIFCWEKKMLPNRSWTLRFATLVWKNLSAVSIWGWIPGSANEAFCFPADKTADCDCACLLKNAPIVILDEATSALDNKSEAVVQKAIDNLMKDRTVFIVAHRLSTVRNADRIVVVNYGEIVESGTHQELLEKENGVMLLCIKVSCDRNGKNEKELLSPAGDPEAGYAALYYGADAVYLGLKHFSARATATNFDEESLDEFVGFAHSRGKKSLCGGQYLGYGSRIASAFEQFGYLFALPD